ncbi:TPR-like protein [Basidiobolus meristosporus CBS 931.73]|uniref:TPR-like protein n=1 Tax=Basidiobolus meristosporus CBS 931.73 TaxID=1314790 RepID=A0A1Y1XY31_9FUNG|nr:TPR-like protein [Basidiobolus meristosporus CBS 931.73]|eukprot:ORX90658.1 TPR-like protein [Basidiobolus meristosporus CBS 931.73]
MWPNGREELNKAIDTFLQVSPNEPNNIPERTTRLFINQLHRNLDQVDPSKLDSILAYLKEAGFQKQRTFNQAIILFGKLGDLSSVLQLFDKMKKLNVPPTTAVYNSVFHILGKTQPAKALALFKDMKSSGVQLNGVTYCILFSVLKQVGTFGEVQLHQQELVIRGIPANLMLYNNLMDTYAKLHRMEKVLQVYNEMQKINIEPNAITYTILIDGYGKNGQVGKARRYFDEMLRKGILPTTKTYNVLIQLCTSRNDISQAVAYYEDMAKRGLKPTQVTYETVLAGCLRSKRADLVDKLSKALRDSEYVGSTIIYNALLNYHRTQGSPAQFHQCISEMDAKGVKPDVVTYNTLLNFGAEYESPEWLDSKYKEMIARNLSPNIITYNTLLKGLVRNQHFEKAWALMAQDAVHPDVVSYNIMVNGYSKAGQMEKAEETVQKMEASNLMPNTTTYNSLIQGYVNCSDVAKASAVYQKLLKDPFVEPDRITNQLKRRYLMRKSRLL